MVKTNPFEQFKSNVCHQLKELGDIPFIVQALKQDKISILWQQKRYQECFYLLAMLDYISRENNVPLCNRYDHLRCHKLQDVLYPSGVLILAHVLKQESIKTEAKKQAIPEFLRFNIVESEVRNVV